MNPHRTSGAAGAGPFEGFRPRLRERGSGMRHGRRGAAPALVSIGVLRRMGNAWSLHWTLNIERSLFGGVENSALRRRHTLPRRFASVNSRALHFFCEVRRLRGLRAARTQLHAGKGHCKSTKNRGAVAGPHPHRRSRRAPRADLDDRDGFSRVRVWILGLSVPVGRGARRGIEAQTQWAMKSPTESSSSSGVSVDQCVHGECDSSTNAIVLVSRVVTDRMAAARLPTWGRIRGPTPLPLLMTIPVSFERVARSLVVAVAVNRHVVLRAIRKGHCGDLHRKWFIGLAGRVSAR